MNAGKQMKKIAALALLIFTSAISYGFEWDPKYDVAVSSCGEADIIRTFRFGIHLNDSFKTWSKYFWGYISKNADNGNSMSDIYSEISGMRDLYEEVILMPCYRRCVEILSAQNNRELATETLKIILSYENSANEEWTLGLGDIYLNNPLLIESCIKSFGAQAREELVEQLATAGELNVNLSRNRPLKERILKLKQVLEMK